MFYRYRTHLHRIAAGFLTLLGSHQLAGRSVFAQVAGISSKTIEEVSGLVVELESQAESQRDQLQRTEASLRRARALLGALQAERVQGITHFSAEEDRQRHALLPAQAVVEKMEWGWSDERANPRYSAEHLGDGYKADISPVPSEPYFLAIRLIHGGKDVYSWKGHAHSVFVQRGDVLYRSDFDPHRNGCAVVAFDLKAGKQLWKTDLWGIGPRNHSQYRNLISMAFDGKYVVVYGNESFGRYVELLDPVTGQTAGHRLVLKEEKEPDVGRKPSSDDAKRRP